MEYINDPESFETSEIVEKSSKSGIFSNQRLLVIRHGFLYYFSKVPKGYKGQIPNLLDNLDELPKSSIQIRSIQKIFTQSPKSKYLSITFYSRDMINRQDLRTSIEKGNLSLRKSNKQDLEEWKFAFTTPLQCRLWNKWLTDLKQHFSKTDDKLQEFIDDFDPSKKSSRSDSSKIFTQTSKRSSFILSPQKPANSVPEPSELKKQEQKQFQQQKQISNIKITDSMNLHTIDQQQELKIKALEEEIRNEIQQQIRKQQKMKAQKEQQEMRKQIKQKQKQVQIWKEKLENSTSQKNNEFSNIRKQEISKLQRIKQLEFALTKKEEQHRQILLRLKEQENLRISLANKKAKELEDLVTKKRQSVIEQSKSLKHIQQQEEQINKLRQQAQNIKRQASQARKWQSAAIDRDPEKKAETKEFSIQTQQQHVLETVFPNQQSKIEQGSLIANENTEETIVQQIESPYKKVKDAYEAVSLFKNNYSKAEQLQFEQTDYYEELGKIYELTDIDTQIQLQTKLIKYINYLIRTGTEQLIKVIEEQNPTSSFSFERGPFTIEVVCASGRIINLKGDDKLVFSKKQHQRLKRQFKIYNKIQNEIIILLKKKKKCPIRVPFCFLVEYRGYSCLIKCLPYIAEKPQLEHQYRKQLDILLKDKKNKFSFHQIKNKQKSKCLLLVKQTYKCTDQNVNLPEDCEISKIIEHCRKHNITTCSTRVSKQTFASSEKYRVHWDCIRFCRQLKDIYRTIQPFSMKDSSFFKAFLQTPQYIFSLLIDPINVTHSGQLLAYIDMLFGVRISEQMQKGQLNYSIQYHPVIRSFNFSGFNSILMMDRFQKYYDQNNNKMLEDILKLMRQIDHDVVDIQILEAKLLIKDQLFSQCIQKIAALQSELWKNDLRIFECYSLLIECFRSMGDAGNLLVQLGSALKWLDETFSGKDDRKAYLYLFTAQTLVKVSRIQDSILIYKMLLNEYQNIIKKEEVYLSISATLLNDCNADPNELIPFIQTLIPLSFDEKQYKIVNDTSAQIVVHLGSLYAQAKNIEKTSQNFQIALKYYLQRMEDNPRMLQTYLSTTEKYLKRATKRQLRQKIYTKTFKQLEKLSFIEDSNSQSLITKIYTLYFLENIRQEFMGNPQIKQPIVEFLTSLSQSSICNGVSAPEKYLTQNQLRAIIIHLIKNKCVPNQIQLLLCQQIDIPEIISILLAS